MAVHPSFFTGSRDLEERLPSLTWAWARQEFTPSWTRMQSALRLALSCTLALTLVSIFNWPSTSNAMLLPLLLSRADVRYDLRQSLWTFGSAALMGSFYYWSLNFSQSPLWFALVLGGGLVLNGALSTLPTVGQAFSTGQILPSSVLATYFYAPNLPQPAFLPLAMELLLGFSVTLSVNYLFWPYSPRKEWDERFRRVWRECQRVTARWFAGCEPAGGFARRPDQLDWQLEEAIGLLDERIKPVDDADPGVELRWAATRRLEKIVTLLHDLVRVGRGPRAEINPAAGARLHEELGARFDHLGSVLEGKETATLNRQADIAGEYEAVAPPGDGMEAVRQDDLCRLRTELDGCPETFRALSRLPGAERATRREQGFTWTPPFRFSDLRKLNAQSWQQGVKIALVVLGSLGMWQALRLPSGGTVLFIAQLVMLPDVGRASRQAIECVLGVLLGLLLAFLSVALVVKYVETIYGYGWCVFGVLLFLGYLSGASPRLAYIGFQGAISYVVVFVSSDRQSVSLEPLRERFVAVVFGVAIALIVLHNVWPVRKVTALFKILADNFVTCAQGWEESLRPDGERLPTRLDPVIRRFQQGRVQASLLTNVIEFEGGEGSSRYGYASRFLTHEVALFGQLHLFALAWKSSAGGTPWPDEVEPIGQQFVTLAHRLGHAVDRPSAQPGSAPGPSTPESAKQVPGWNLLQQRAREITRILASLDRLTSLPVSNAEPGAAKNPAGLPMLARFINVLKMPIHQNAPPVSSKSPAPENDAPRFADGVVPEAPPRSRGLLVFGSLALVIVTVVLLRALSGGTPFLLVFGAYFPAWFSAGIVGALLSAITIMLLRSHPLTRMAGTGLVMLNCTVIYAFLAWLLLFNSPSPTVVGSFP